MNIENAAREFQLKLAGLRLRLDELRVQQGLAAMLSFYQETRANDCDLNADGDMLLFQWGTTHLPRAQRRFIINITRQLIPTDAEGEIWQLGLTFEFDAVFDRVGAGDEWCGDLSEVALFEASVTKSEAVDAVRDCTPLAVKLTFENVE